MTAHDWRISGWSSDVCSSDLVALTFVAAVTERIRLIPNICVLPYRNPFIVAKSIATLCMLSDDRFTLAAGTGYLRGEYRSEERRGGKECVSQCRSQWSP